MSVNLDWLALVSGVVTSPQEPIAPLRGLVEQCLPIVAIVNLQGS